MKVVIFQIADKKYAFNLATVVKGFKANQLLEIENVQNDYLLIDLRWLFNRGTGKDFEAILTIFGTIFLVENILGLEEIEAINTKTNHGNLVEGIIQKNGESINYLSAEKITRMYYIATKPK